MDTVVRESQRWDTAHPDAAALEWSALPDDLRWDTATPGSPGWVRCQSVHLLRDQYAAAVARSHQRVQTVDDLCQRQMFVLCPYIDATAIVDAFNRYRRAHRQHQTPTQTARQAVQPYNTASVSEGGTDGMTNMGTHTGHVGLSLRMHLDTGLVREIIRETTHADPLGHHFVGFCLIDHHQRLIDNGMLTSMLMTRAMQSIVHEWYRRFSVPLPYHSPYVDGAMVRRAIQRLSMNQGTLQTDVCQFSPDVLDHRTLIFSADLRRDAEQRFQAAPYRPYHAVPPGGYCHFHGLTVPMADVISPCDFWMYPVAHCLGLPLAAEPPAMVDDARVLGSLWYLVRHRQVTLLPDRQALLRKVLQHRPLPPPGFEAQDPVDRELDDLHGSFCVLESAVAPPPIVRPRETVAREDPLVDLVVTTEKEALSLLVTVQLYQASQLQEEIAQNRCRSVEHGFTGAGRWQAVCDAEARRLRTMPQDGLCPTVYLGAHSHTVLQP